MCLLFSITTTYIMLYFSLFFLFFQFRSVSCVIRCYNCTNTDPKCNWETQSVDCPVEDDLCVIISQTRGELVQYTMGCLSVIDDFRTDLPFRRKPGCRPAKTTTIDSIVYDDVTYCFCRFIDDCINGNGFRLVVNPLILLFTCVCYIICK